MSAPEFTAIGIDIGGTKIAAGLVLFPSGEVHERQQIASDAGRGGEAMLEQISELAAKLAERGHEIGVRPRAIGLGICEIVSREGQIASSATVPLSESLVRARLSGIAPVTLEADVRAAARAEAIFGAGRGHSSFLYVSIGTGISCCLVIDGEPFAGARGATGTMASGPMPSPDFAKLNPSLEQFASGPALVSRFNGSGGNVRRAQEVLAAAGAGDANARQVVQSGGAALGGTIGLLVNVLDPAVVILGGGLGLSEGLFRETLIEAARKHIWWPGHRDVPILPAETGINAGLIGAAAAAWMSSLRAKKSQ